MRLKALLGTAAACVTGATGMAFVSPAEAQMYQDSSGRWVNSAGGNIYGDSRYNIDADPNYNINADPNYNINADPNYNIDADPNYSMCGIYGC